MHDEEAESNEACGSLQPQEGGVEPVNVPAAQAKHTCFRKEPGLYVG